MRFIFRGLLIFVSSFVLASCGYLAVLSFKADENSGVKNDQTVHIAYVNSEMFRDENRSASLARECEARACLKLEEPYMPDQIRQICVGSQPMPQPPSADGEMTIAVAPALAPFVVAGGQAAFDAVTGVIDARREEIRKAAVREYGVTVVRNDLALGSISHECVVVWREVAGIPAMVSAYLIEGHGLSDGAGAAALTLTPIYLRVDRAAAETERASIGRAKINLNQTITIAAVQTNPVTNTPSVRHINTSPFSYSGVELGAATTERGIEYANRRYVPEEFFADPDRRELDAARGPIFLPPRTNPAVGTISVAVVERGSEAALDEVSATEKATRASIRAAIGSSIQEALKE